MQLYIVNEVEFKLRPKEWIGITVKAEYTGEYYKPRKQHAQMQGKNYTVISKDWKRFSVAEWITLRDMLRTEKKKSEKVGTR
jgi:hypothetical protein